MSKKLNVLFLMSDQHKASVSGCYGHPMIKTPNIDRIAKRGIKYDRAYCASPLSGPSRMACITGTYPNKNWNITHPNIRHRTGKKYDGQLNPITKSLVNVFQKQGYKTFGTGYSGLHYHIEGEEQPNEYYGFDIWKKLGMNKKREEQYHKNNIHSEMWEPNYQNVDGNTWDFKDEVPFDTHVSNNICSFLESQDNSEPFFAYAGFRAPHPPWVPPKEFRDMYNKNDIELPDYKIEYRNKPRRVMERLQYYDCRYYPEEVVRESMASYYGFVSYMDHCIGQILDTLEKRGLLENTLIIYSTDHGELLYDNGLCEKHTFFEGAVKIPLIFSAPGIIPENVSCEHLVENIDIMPTALGLAGLDIPSYCNGVDLNPTFHGDSVKNMVFSEYYHSLDPCRMLIRGKYKYIHTENDINELYDLENDSLEEHNLAFYPGYADICREMEQLVLRDWDIPEVPLYATWNDLNERKQNQLLNGLKIHNFRPKPPSWIKQ